MVMWFGLSLGLVVSLLAAFVARRQPDHPIPRQVAPYTVISSGRSRLDVREYWERENWDAKEIACTQYICGFFFFLDNTRVAPSLALILTNEKVYFNLLATADWIATYTENGETFSSTHTSQKVYWNNQNVESHYVKRILFICSYSVLHILKI